MSKFLILFDSNANDRNYANNYVVYTDTAEKVLKDLNSARDALHITKVKDDSKIIDEINMFYNEGKSEFTHCLDNGILPMILDDEDCCIPCQKYSFLLMLDHGKETHEEKVIENRIAGYTLDMWMEDLDYSSCSLGNRSYSHGTHIGYDVTGLANAKKQTISLSGKTNRIIECLRIINVDYFE